MSLEVNEYVILSNQRLTSGDIGQISKFISSLFDTRGKSGPVVLGLFDTERKFEMDFRPSVLMNRYSKGEK